MIQPQNNRVNFWLLARPVEAKVCSSTIAGSKFGLFSLI